MALEIGQSKACRELNLPEHTIYGWMHAYRMGKLDLDSEMQTPARALTMNEELRALRKQVKEQAKEIKRLREEKEFLEESSTFFAASRRKSQGRETVIHFQKDLRRHRVIQELENSTIVELLSAKVNHVLWVR